MVDLIEETTLALKAQEFRGGLVVANKLLVSEMKAINLLKQAEKPNERRKQIFKPEPRPRKMEKEIIGSAKKRS